MIVAQDGQYEYEGRSSQIVEPITGGGSTQGGGEGDLTTLAPDILAAILEVTLPMEVMLFDSAAGTPLLWEGQRGELEGDRRVARELPVDFWEKGVYSFLHHEYICQ